MNKEQKEMVVIVAGALILLMVVMGNMKRKKIQKPITEKNPAVQLPAAASAVSLVPSKSSSLTEKVAQTQKDREGLPWGRDPFTAEFDKAAKISELKLQGISYGTDGAGFAFINEEIVKKGGKIGDYEVTEVLKDKVLLKKDNQSFYLTFTEE